MNPDQGIILAILAATIVLFLWARWRHDIVALASLLACVAAGLVPPADDHGCPDFGSSGTSAGAT